MKMKLTILGDSEELRRVLDAEKLYAVVQEFSGQMRQMYKHGDCTEKAECAGYWRDRLYLLLSEAGITLE